MSGPPHDRGVFARRAQIEGLDDDRGARLELAFQNEWVVVWRRRRAGGDVARFGSACSTRCRATRFGTETIRYGMRATVIALPAPRCSSRRKALAHVGPRAFGYDIEFKSVFA